MPRRVSLRNVNHLINLDGEIDLCNRDELLIRLTTLTIPARQRYTLDLTAVTFMDCSGINVVLALDRRVRATGGALHIGAVSPQAARVFDILALDDFPTHLMPGPTPRGALPLTASIAA
jgi:anti-anti-sigma factor